MDKFKALLSSSIGKKFLMAVTGLAMIGFLITHVLANLLVLIDAEAYNHYSHALISNPMIYLAEFGLVALFVGHFVSGIVVTRGNRAARTKPYAQTARAGGPSRKSLASSTMIISGLVLLVFVPLHLWQMKFGTFYASAAEPEVRDLARLVHEIFQSPMSVFLYIVALMFMGFHAWHGFGSAFESLGVHHNKELRRVGQSLAAFLTVGFIVIPVIIYIGGGAQ